jgi:hypothetical protein
LAQRPKILETWEEVQHDPLTLPPDNFDGLSQDEAAELIKDWFLQNFEDPAHHTPYESAEGGYEYIWAARTMRATLSKTCSRTPPPRN